MDLHTNLSWGAMGPQLSLAQAETRPELSGCVGAKASPLHFISWLNRAELDGYLEILRVRACCSHKSAAPTGLMHFSFVTL